MDPSPVCSGQGGDCGYRDEVLPYKLKVEADFAGCISQSFNLAVIDITAAIKDHCFNALSLGTLSHQFSNFDRRRDIGSGRLVTAEVSLRRAYSSDRLAGLIIDD